MLYACSLRTGALLFGNSGHAEAIQTSAKADAYQDGHLLDVLAGMLELHTSLSPSPLVSFHVPFHLRTRVVSSYPCLQGIVISMINSMGKIQDPEDAKALQNFMICVEMSGSSIMMYFAFPTNEYKMGGATKGLRKEAFAHAISIKDVVADTVHQVNQLALKFTSSTPAKEHLKRSQDIENLECIGCCRCMCVKSMQWNVGKKKWSWCLQCSMDIYILAYISALCTCVCVCVCMMVY